MKSVDRSEHEIKLQAVNEFKQTEIKRIEDEHNAEYSKLETTLKEQLDTEREKMEVEVR